MTAGAHRLAGRFWFRVGGFERAREHFERVLELKGDDFVAYVHLARLAYCLGDYAGCKREYEHARRTAPDRYARLENPFDLFEPRAAGTMRDEAGERATWRSTLRREPMHLPQGMGSSRGGEAVAGRPATSRGACPDGPRIRRSGDDFRDEQERARFRELRPIDPQELSGLDLDRLLDRF